MVDIVDFILGWFLNSAMIAACVWVILRAVEKAYDILIKYRQYEDMTKEKE